MWQVLSGAFQWVPQGKQAKVLAKTPPRPCDDDILLLKLRPGQVCRSARIAAAAKRADAPKRHVSLASHANRGAPLLLQGVELEAHCEKGIGSTHAKWSPVATASYRLLPTVEFVEPIEVGCAMQPWAHTCLCAPGRIHAPHARTPPLERRTQTHASVHEHVGRRQQSLSTRFGGTFAA